MSKFTIHAVYKGYPIDIEFEGKSDQLEFYIDSLDGMGATPPSEHSAAATSAEQEAAAPVCQWHGAMQASSKVPGTFFCSRKMGDGSYCKSKA